MCVVPIYEEVIQLCMLSWNFLSRFMFILYKVCKFSSKERVWLFFCLLVCFCILFFFSQKLLCGRQSLGLEIPGFEPKIHSLLKLYHLSKCPIVLFAWISKLKIAERVL